MTVNVNGKRIRELRLERSWSQETLAEHAGVSLRTIQRMEADGVASLKSRLAVAEVFGVRAPELDPGAHAAPTGDHPNQAGRDSVISVVRARKAYWRSFDAFQRRATAAAFALSAIAIGASCYLLLPLDRSGAETEPFVTVGYGNIESPIPAEGVLLPKRVAPVAIDMFGGNIELLVRVGDRVVEGQALAEVEHDRGLIGVTSPLSGTIISLEPSGAIVNGVQTAPLTIKVADFETMTFHALIPETDLPAVRVGTEAYVTTLVGGARRWRGSLRDIHPLATIRDDVVSYTGFVDVDNADRSLYDRMTARVFFLNPSAENVLTVPVGALKRSNRTNGASKSIVEVVLPNGTSETREIVVGARDRVNAEVVSGLQEGDRIVLSRNQDRPL